MDLETIFTELNGLHFADSLPLPILRWNSRLSSTAGRFCPGSRIHIVNPRKCEIEVATYLRELADGEMHVRDTILHEMIHYHLWHSGKPYGHTEEFRRILKKVGAKRFNPVPKLRPYKHLYECPKCRKQIPARRRIEDSACRDCCKKYASGNFDRRFLLLPAIVREREITLAEQPALSPSEIVRRLEELKQMLLRKTSTVKT